MKNFIFDNPDALQWALLAIPIAIFYLLPLGRRRESVATSIFWRQVLPRARMPRPLRHFLSLCVQLLFIGLLILALLQPAIVPTDGKQHRFLDSKRHTVLVVDNSASMNVKHDEKTRLDEAKAMAKEFAQRLRIGDEMSVISSGNVQQVRCGLTSHRKSIREAIESIRPTDDSTHVEQAVRLAHLLLKDKQNKKVIVLSDGCFSIVPQPTNKDPDVFDGVALYQVGQAAKNVAITRLAIRESPVDPIGVEILVEVSNFSDDKAEVDLELSLDGLALEEKVAINLKKDESWSKTYQLAYKTGGRLSAKIFQPDDRLQDNEAWVSIPPRKPRRVFLAQDSTKALVNVFQAMPLVEVALGDPRLVQKATNVTVFEGSVPERLPKGPVLVIDPVNDCEYWAVGPTLNDQIVDWQQQDNTSPVLKNVHLRDVLIQRPRQLRLKKPVRELAKSKQGAVLLFWIERPGGNILVLTGKLEKSDLISHRTFPILMSNALDWLSGRQELSLEPRVAGKVTNELPLSSVVLESDLRPRADIENTKEKLPEKIAWDYPAWYFLLGFALILAPVEWYLYQRRWIS